MTSNSQNIRDNIQNSNSNNRNLIELSNFPLVENNQCLYVLDWSNSQVVFTRGVNKMLGYSEEEFNLGVVLNNIHPEDKLLVNRILKASIKLAINSNLKKETTFLNKSFRIQKRDGTYIKILSQSSPYQICKKGKLLSSLTILTDLSFMKTNNIVVWEIFSNQLNIAEFRQNVYDKYSKLYSKRELDIIRLLKKHYTSKQIAAKINISPHTVVTHRKNIFKKTNCHSVKELITFCENNGVL